MSTTAPEITAPVLLPGAWSLAELLPGHDAATISAELATLEGELKAFEACRSQLNAEMDPALLMEVVRDYEQLVAHLYRLDAYGDLWFSADTLSPEALAYRNRAQQAVTAAVNRTLFFDLWWKSLDDDEAAALLPPVAYPDYRHHLENLRRTKPYTLDERSEQIINLKDADGMSGLLTLYTMITNRFEFMLDVDDERKALTRDALMSYVQGPVPTLRAAAYQELYRVYGDEAAILAQIYTNRVRDWANEQIGVRGYATPIQVRNIANDIPDAAVDALLNVCRRNVGVFQRYFRLKAGWLGMEKLRRYDIYAPLGGSDRQFDYATAVQLVLDTFARFDPAIAQQAQRVFDDNHIYSAVRKGKRGGAFCATVLPSLTPWVLMSYTGRVRDVATLAHELGHAIHSMLAEGHSLLTQQPGLPLAETASVFAEQLLTNALLAQEQDPAVRRELLAAAVDDAYATVMRQAFFVIFEREAHQAILENKSPADLNALYMELLGEQFGDSVEIAPEFQHEWVSIPHIYYTPFYCYAYAFGQLLVLALYRRFQEEGDAFKPGYLKLLAYGGAEHPEKILREAGIDVTDESFWQGGFDVISSMIDEMETL